MAANRIWADIETNGRDPRNDAHIFELALVATTADAEYRELAHQSWVIGWDVDDAWLRARMTPEVYQMHQKSGLLYEIPFGHPIAEVEAEACKFVDFFGNPAPGREPIAGSSIHFDRNWLELHMPRLMKRFGHRNFCASTLTRFARDLGVFEESADGASNPNSRHRALDDVRYSIKIARDLAKLVRR